MHYKFHIPRLRERRLNIKNPALERDILLFLLLFLVLESLKLAPGQISTVIALALGINPLLDMFETACNVAGDNVGTYVVGKKLGMIEKE